MTTCHAASTTTAPFKSTSLLRTLFPDKAPQEVPGDSDAEVTVLEGAIPEWLTGSYVRNGGGHYPAMRHMFDGYGMLVKLRFEGGRAFASQRLLRSRAYEAFLLDGAPRWSEFGTATPLPQGLWNTFLGLTGWGQGFTDNGAVTVAQADGGDLIAMTELAGGTWQVDSDTLATLRSAGFDDDVQGVITTAHPRIFPDNTVINLVQNALPVGGCYSIVRHRLGASSREVVAVVPVKNNAANSWAHDLPVSDNYAIIPETPILYSFTDILTADGKYVVFDWEPANRTLLRVVPLDGSPVRDFTCPAYFAFHYLNTFETVNAAGERCICIDVCWFDDPALVPGLSLSYLRGEQPLRPVEEAIVRRITINLDSGREEVDVRQLVADTDSYGNSFELPTVNSAYKGKPYRYAYADCATGRSVIYNTVCKFDLQEGVTSATFHLPGAAVGEPYFVARPGGEDEDDGALLVMMTMDDGASRCAVLDARSLDMLAFLGFPHSVPYGFHGTWIPSSGTR